MDDLVVKKIYDEFDRAEQDLQQDVMNESILDLYKKIHEKTIKGEFTREQLLLIQPRAQKSVEFVAQIKQRLQEKAVSNSETHTKIQSYLKNSF